ncbi:MAG: hypothetical protein P9M00_03860 [Candidatus Tritonobacter lacicola]|nr:hypothetical protein [Candidatus Tritonobacter lacicola]
MERIIEQSKDTYYESLGNSSENWHQGRHDILPWFNYYLGVLRAAYREFEERAGSVSFPKGAKTELVEKAVEAFVGDFTVRDIQRAVPNVGIDMIRRVLRQMRLSGTIVCLKRGRTARWRKKK